MLFCFVRIIILIDACGSRHNMRTYGAVHERIDDERARATSSRDTELRVPLAEDASWRNGPGACICIHSKEETTKKKEKDEKKKKYKIIVGSTTERKHRLLYKQVSIDYRLLNINHCWCKTANIKLAQLPAAYVALLRCIRQISTFNKVPGQERCERAFNDDDGKSRAMNNSARISIRNTENETDQSFSDFLVWHFTEKREKKNICISTACMYITCHQKSQRIRLSAFRIFLLSPFFIYCCCLGIIRKRRKTRFHFVKVVSLFHISCIWKFFTHLSTFFYRVWYAQAYNGPVKRVAYLYMKVVNRPISRRCRGIRRRLSHLDRVCVRRNTTSLVRWWNANENRNRNFRT